MFHVSKPNSVERNWNDVYEAASANSTYSLKTKFRRTELKQIEDETPSGTIDGVSKPNSVERNWNKELLTECGLEYEVSKPNSVERNWNEYWKESLYLPLNVSKPNSVERNWNRSCYTSLTPFHSSLKTKFRRTELKQQNPCQFSGIPTYVSKPNSVERNWNILVGRLTRDPELQ